MPGMLAKAKSALGSRYRRSLLTRRGRFRRLVLKADDAAHANRWSDVHNMLVPAIERYPAIATAKAHRLAGAGLRHRHHLDRANEIIEAGLARFPDDVGLRLESAAMAFAQSDYEMATALIRAIANEGALSARGYGIWSRSLRRRNDIEGAREVVEMGLKALPGNLNLLRELVEVAVEQEDWTTAELTIRKVIPRSEIRFHSQLTMELANVLYRQGEIKKADLILDLAHLLFDANPVLKRRRAESAMAVSDWETATPLWEAYLARTKELVLPLSGHLPEWFSVSWTRLAEHLIDSGATASIDLLVGLSNLLADEGRHQLAIRLLQYGRDRDPTNPPLRLKLSSLLATQGRGEEAWGELDCVINWSEFEVDMFNDSLLHSDPPGDRIRQLLVPNDSASAIQIRSGNFYNREKIDGLIARLSEVGRWPEITARANPVEAAARRASLLYSRRFASDYSTLDGQSLPIAISSLIEQEMWTALAMRRAARHIIETVGRTAPVFVETGSRFTYFNGYYRTSFENLVLYVELVRHGANAYAVDFTGSLASEPIEVRPYRLLMQSRPPVNGLAANHSHSAFVPAGIRSTSKILASLDDPVIFSSSSIVPDFAYERHFTSSIKPHASYLPDRERFPTLTFEMTPRRSFQTVALTDDGFESAEVLLRESEPLASDWGHWLHEVAGEYVEELSVRCHEEFVEREIKRLHVSDLPYLESAVASVVTKQLGGEVTLWPHSSNPSHISGYGSHIADAVHSVTRTGAAEWRRLSPTTEILHTPHLMLELREDLDIDPNQPLSIVVIGGKSRLGPMPYIRQSEHVQSHLDFFEGISQIQQKHDVRVFYKPKGSGLESENWLADVLDDIDLEWHVIRTHPLKLDVPNPLFVSMSIGSSALLEGLSRSIPCVIVKDATCREYLTIAGNVIPTGRSDEILEIIESLVDPDEYASFRRKQTSAFRDEIDSDSDTDGHDDATASVGQRRGEERLIR